MARLRDPDGGCPWDLEQNFATIAPYTIEEAYEVAEAIDRRDMDALKDELGDLLLQVVFHARMAEEDGLFDFESVAQAISDKMIRRHPHVFGNENVESTVAQTAAWEDQKAVERLAMAEAEGLRQMLIDSFYDEHILGYGYLVDENGKNLYNPSKDHPLYRRFVSSLYCGTIEMIVEEFKRYEALGVEMVFLPSQQRELIAKEILPEFR